MGFIHDKDIFYAKVFNSAVAGTLVEVTSNPNSLLYSFTLYTVSSGPADAYLQVFDAPIANVTLGTTTPTFVIGVASFFNQHVPFPKPVRFTSGFTIASTTTRTGNIGVTMEVTITYMDAA